jgi:hypothetical protein
MNFYILLWLYSILVSLGINAVGIARIINNVKKHEKEIDWEKLKQNYIIPVYEDPNFRKTNPYICLLQNSIMPPCNFIQSLAFQIDINNYKDEIVDILDEIGILIEKNKTNMIGSQKHITDNIKEVNVQMSDIINKAEEIVINASRADVLVTSEDKTGLYICTPKENIIPDNNHLHYEIHSDGKLVMNEVFNGKDGLSKIILNLSKESKYKSIAIKTISGRAEAFRLKRGRIYVSTLSGDIQMGEVDIPIYITTAIGDIILRISNNRRFYSVSNESCFGKTFVRDAFGPKQLTKNFISIKSLKSNPFIEFNDDDEA